MGPGVPPEANPHQSAPSTEQERPSVLGAAGHASGLAEAKRGPSASDSSKETPSGSGLPPSSAESLKQDGGRDQMQADTCPPANTRAASASSRPDPSGSRLASPSAPGDPQQPQTEALCLPTLNTEKPVSDGTQSEQRPPHGSHPDPLECTGAQQQPQNSSTLSPSSSLTSSHPPPHLPSQPNPAVDPRNPLQQNSALKPGAQNGNYKPQTFGRAHPAMLGGNHPGIQAQRGGLNPAAPPPHPQQGLANGAMGPYGPGSDQQQQRHLGQANMPTHHYQPQQHPSYHQQGALAYPYHMAAQQHPNMYPPHQYQQQQHQYYPQHPAHGLPSSRGSFPADEWHHSHYQAPRPVPEARPEEQNPTSPSRQLQKENTTSPESPKEILDLDSHNAAGRHQAAQRRQTGVSAAHVMPGYMYDPRAVHPGMQQGGVPPPHMLSHGHGGPSRASYPAQPYPDPACYAAQRPHPHLMEALQRPQQLPYSPGQTRSPVYRQTRPAGSYQGMMMQQRGLPPEHFLHPG